MNLNRLRPFAKPYRPMKLTEGSVVLVPSGALEVMADARPGAPSSQFPDGAAEVDVRHSETGIAWTMRWNPFKELGHCITGPEWEAHERWLTKGKA